MSRSIHTTHKYLDEIRRWSYGDSTEKRTRVKEAREHIAKKRRIKFHIESERHTGEEPLAPTLSDSVPMDVRDVDLPQVHFPAGPEDIAAVMRLLPRGVLDGLAQIRLCLGSEEQAEDELEDEPLSVDELPKPDPLTGRLGYEVLPGTYSGRYLGIHSRSSIYVFAYVYDASNIRDLAIWEFWLRLRMLATFVHEVAHHFDSTSRTARGRWIMDSEERVEIYAERLQHQWMKECVIPYLEHAYPSERRALAAWLGHHGGMSLPLDVLAGDPRARVKGGRVNINNTFFNMRYAFERLVESVMAGERETSTRLKFASDLHFADLFREAAEIVEGILTREPEHLEALTLRADIHEHQAEYDAAASLARKALSLDSAQAHAWEVLLDAHEGLTDWSSVIEVATALRDLPSANVREKERALLARARAWLELGNLASFATDMTELEQSTRAITKRRVAYLREEAAKRHGLAAGQ